MVLLANLGLKGTSMAIVKLYCHPVAFCFDDSLKTNEDSEVEDSEVALCPSVVIIKKLCKWDHILTDYHASWNHQAT